MRNFLIIAVTLLALLISKEVLAEQTQYYQHFTDERIRVDIIFAGDAQTQLCYLESMHYEPLWGGSRNSLIEEFNYGEYNYRVETLSGEIIFSKGFSTLFFEWRTTPQAKTLSRAFSSSLTIPFPKESVNLIISERSKESGDFYDMAHFTIDPLDKKIRRDKEHNYTSHLIHGDGNYKNRLDLLFLAEGYREDQMDEFCKDAARFVDYLFDIEPYKSRKEDFNIWITQSISQDGGTDIPHENIWANTALSSTFYTFGIDRYLTTPNQTLVAQAASQVPYDALYVIVNTDKYGGGGIYNFYGLSMARHKYAGEVFVHELGHSLAGLGDEYYTSEVAYENFYNLALEPWEPNITTQVNFESKWADLIGSGEASLFEGGGYMSKGVFRAAESCRMKSNDAPGFCVVCSRAINRMIDNYTK